MVINFLIILTHKNIIKIELKSQEVAPKFQLIKELEKLIELAKAQESESENAPKKDKESVNTSTTVSNKKEAQDEEFPFTDWIKSAIPNLGDLFVQ